MSIVAKPESAHWYDTRGNAMHEVARADGDGMRATTLADARKLNLLPSVTTVLSILAKPELERWKLETMLESALTTPRLEGEDLHAFATRIDAERERVTQLACDFGTRLHSLCEAYAADPACVVAEELQPYRPHIQSFFENNVSEVVASERSVVGVGYAGRIDLLARNKDKRLTLFDFKTQKYRKGKASYWDTYLWQLAAYQFPLEREFREHIDIANVAINSQAPEPFQIKVWSEEERRHAWSIFRSVLNTWQLVKGYVPQQ